MLAAAPASPAAVQTDAPAPPAAPRWRRFFRFSLLTLLLVSMALGSGGLFYQRTKDGPWRRTILRENFIGDVAWSPTGDRVMVLNGGHTFSEVKREAKDWELIDCATGTARKVPVAPFSNIYRFSPDGSHFLMVTKERYSIWNASTLENTNWIARSEYPVQSVIFTHDGKYVAATTFDGKNMSIMIHASDTGNIHKRLDLGANAIPHTMAFSHNGRLIAHGVIAAKNSTDLLKEHIWIWDVESERQVKTITLPDNYAASPIAFTPRDDFLIAGQSHSWNLVTTTNERRFSRVFDTTHFREQSPLLAILAPDPASFSPDGRFLAWSQKNPAMAGLSYPATYDFKTGLHSVEFGGEVENAHFSPSGHRVITDQGVLCDFPECKKLANFGNCTHVYFLNETTIVTQQLSPGPIDWAARNPVSLCRWERHYPEPWWGRAYLWQFWLTALFALASAWSFARDWRTL